MLADLTETNVVWKSKGLSNEEIRPPPTVIKSLSSKLKIL